jgi:hypothetical protein
MTFQKKLSNLKNYKMYRLYQFNFFNILPNKLMQSKFREEKLSMIKSVFVTILLVCFFITIYIILVVVISDIYHRYRYYIIKVWLLPSLVQLIIVRFCINYTLNLFRSYLLFKHYGNRKSKCVVKYLYYFLIGKHIMYMFRTRNFITKYYPRFKSLLKNCKLKEKVPPE